MTRKNGGKNSVLRFVPLIIVGIASLLVLKIAAVVDFVVDNSDVLAVKDAHSEDNSPAPAENKVDYKDMANSPRQVNNKIGAEYSEISQGELEVLEQLAKRREVVEAKEKELEQRMALIEAAEKQLDTKITQLKKIKETIEQMVDRKEKEDAQKLANLVKIYSNMKPKDAARIFDDLDMEILIDIFQSMREQKSSAILAVMNPTKANALTVELAKPKKLPFKKE